MPDNLSNTVSIRFKLVAIIIYGRFLLQPVLRSDDMKCFVVLPRRWVIERTFAWLTQYQRLTRDYEVLPASSEAMSIWRCPA
jgi:transposase